MTDTKTIKHEYLGSPGYAFLFASGTCVLNPGDRVDLTDEEAASVGPDEFKPVKGAKPAAPAADPEGDQS